LLLGTDGGEVTFHKPAIYQPTTYNEPRTANQEQRTKNQELVEGKYALKGNHITFDVASYDKTRPLVIDPVLIYSTYLGGSGGDGASAMAVDALGNAYVTGSISSTDFPTTSGAFQTFGGGADAFVSKLNPTGSALLYSTYLGGRSGGGWASAIVVDVSGNAYVTGSTYSSDFPTTPGAFQTTHNPEGCGIYSPCTAAFLSKLNAAGSGLVYSTYLGVNSAGSAGSGIAVDASGNAYVTGITETIFLFPTTPGAFQIYPVGTCPPDCWNSFVTKFNFDGSALVYSTYLGGTDSQTEYVVYVGIAIDSTGNAYVTGTATSDFPTTPGAFQTTFAGGFIGDAFVSKLNPSGSALVYSTYLGGTDYDAGYAIAIDTQGNAYVTGSTRSSDFPTTPGAFQDSANHGSFVTKLNPAGSALVYSTASIGGGAIALDALGDAYATGSTWSSSFPTTRDALQPNFGGGWNDAFVSKLNPAGSALLYSTYLGGSGGDGGAGIALDPSGNVYISGATGSADFPTIPGAFQARLHGVGEFPSDVFVAKISLADAPGLALGPGKLLFHPQAVGTASSPQTVTLLAPGSQPLSITSVLANGDFGQSNTCGSAVPSGTSCTISVTFTPRVTGTRNGLVTITDNAAGSPHELLLSGTGIAGSGPAVSLNPASLPFFVLRTVGTTSSTQIVKLSNVGSGQFEIAGITVTGTDSGDFGQSNDCPGTVAGGASCLITVTFRPTGQGVRTASISITDNAPGSPQAVPLSGRGTFLKWSPREMNLGNQPVGTSSAARTVTLTNAGSTAITLYSIEVSGVNPGDFTQTNTCGSSLNPGASCTIQVTFTPTAAGSRLGHVAIRDSAFGGTHWVGLIGKGT
jgi:hypothetical protein